MNKIDFSTENLYCKLFIDIIFFLILASLVVNTDDKNWLLHHSTPWDTVEKLWSNTYIERKFDIDKSSVNIGDILTDWPLYKNTNGFRLVSYSKKLHVKYLKLKYPFGEYFKQKLF